MAATATPGQAAKSPLPAVVRGVVKAMEARDRDQLVVLQAGYPDACSNLPSTGIGGGAPPCPAGVQEGTFVRRFVIVGNCEGGGATVGSAVSEMLLKIIDEGGELQGAVLAHNDAAFVGPDYAVVFRAPDGVGRIVHISDSGVLAIGRGCGASAAETLANLKALPGAIAYDASEVRR